MKSKMMRAAVAALLLATSATYGVINITWYADGGFLLAGNPLLDPAVKSTLVQLIQVNGSIDPVDLSDPTDYLTGDDVLLQQVVYTNTANNGFSEYAAVTFGVYTQSFSSYSFYARVFQDATPAAGELYMSTSNNITLTQNKGDAETQFYNLNDNHGGLNGFQLDTPIAAIPEPATMAFMGFGLLGLAARALRRRVS